MSPKISQAEKEAEEIAAIQQCVDDPILWIKAMWGLKPQPFKNITSYKLAQNTPLKDWRAEWFGKFVNGKNFTWQQYVILLAVRRATRGEDKERISIAAGVGLGKSAVLAMIILWFLYNHDECLVPCTAPSESQLYGALWKELRLWHGRMPQEWKDRVEITNNYATMIGEGKEKAKVWWARAKTARDDKPEALAGIHANDVLIVTDESCHDHKTEVLTSQGWKLFEDLEKDEKVLTMDKETHIAYYEKVQRRIMMPYRGKMYEPSASRGISFSITPNHDLYLKSQKNKGFKKIKPDNVKTDMAGLTCVKWAGKERDIFSLPFFASRRGRKESIRFNMNDWLEFLGWYVSEGSLLKRRIDDGKMRYNGVVISQMNTKNRDRIRLLLKRMEMPFSENAKGFVVHGVQLGMYLSRYGVGFDKKRVPRYVMGLSPRQIKIFLKSFMLGDGYMKKKAMVLYTSGDGLVDDLHELCSLAGYRTTIKTRRLKGKTQWIIDHWATSSKDGYAITASAVSNFYIKNRRPLKKVDYDGMVYCATVKSGLLYTRRNGYCMWSGNSAISRETFTKAEGALTSPHLLFVMISNPTRTTGYFYDSHHKDSKAWQTLTFANIDSPIVNQAYVDRVRQLNGEDSDEWRFQVLGLFPRTDAADDKGYMQIFREGSVKVVHDANYTFKNPRMGVDPAFAGSDSAVWIIRDSFRCKRVGVEKISNPMQIAQKTMGLMESYGVKAKDVYIDSFGSDTVDAIQILERHDKRVNAVNVGDDAEDETVFENKKAENYDRMKKWTMKGGEYLGSASEWEDLQLVRSKRSGKADRVKIKTKEEMRRDKEPSPNTAEAVMLTFQDDDEGFVVATEQDRERDRSSYQQSRRRLLGVKL